MPILDSRTIEFISRSPDQTRRIGMRLGSLLQKGDVICLYGELGSGKTTLTKGIAQGWGSLDLVTSPTFIIVNTYSRPDQEILYHLDAYRLQNAIEAEDLDIDQMLETGIMIVEWPENIDSVLTEERLSINLSWIHDEQRGMIFLPQGRYYEKMIEGLRQRAFGG